MWLACATQEEIAKAVDAPQQTVEDWLKNFSKNSETEELEKWHNFDPPIYKSNQTSRPWRARIEPPGNSNWNLADFNWRMQVIKTNKIELPRHGTPPRPVYKVAPMTPRPITTAQLAENCMVNPNSIRVYLCKRGHYFGLVPDKLPNGRLAWPGNWREKMVPSAKKARA